MDIDLNKKPFDKECLLKVACFTVPFMNLFSFPHVSP
jgi:hypothetical protein